MKPGYNEQIQPGPELFVLTEFDCRWIYPIKWKGFNDFIATVKNPQYLMLKEQNGMSQLFKAKDEVFTQKFVNFPQNFRKTRKSVFKKISR